MKCLVATLALSALTVGTAPRQAPPPANAETRILDYIEAHLQPGQPLMVSDLYNNVFTQPEERQALNKLYNAFFRVPIFVADYQQSFGHPPTLEVIAQQFALTDPHAAAVLLEVMQDDPRVPRFIERDPKTGEITHADVKEILSDPRFREGLERQLTGWQGKPAPAFSLSRLDGSGSLESASLKGKVALLYVWFTGCPPCMEETPDLVTLQHDFAKTGLEIVGANADRVLGLSATEVIRKSYLARDKVQFPVVEWDPLADRAYGSISIFLTLFLIGRDGTVQGHWVGYVSPSVLRRSIENAMAASAPHP